MALKTRRLHENGTNDVAGPLLTSTKIDAFPMSRRLKAKPERASRDKRTKSWSRGCSNAISLRSKPRGSIELMTHFRSSILKSGTERELFEGLAAAESRSVVDMRPTGIEPGGLVAGVLPAGIEPAELLVVLDGVLPAFVCAVGAHCGAEGFVVAVASRLFDVPLTSGRVKRTLA